MIAVIGHCHTPEVLLERVLTCPSFLCGGVQELVEICDPACEGEVVEDDIKGTTIAVVVEVVEKGQNFPTGSTAYTYYF